MDQTFNAAGLRVSITPTMLLVVDMFKETKSYGPICAALNLTIGQVAGNVRRARENGLLPPSVPRVKHARVRKPKAAEKKAIPERTTPFRPPVEIMKPKRVRLTLINGETAVTFEELELHHCRFPIGDPKLPDFKFCGKPKISNSPYCKEHTKLAFHRHT